MKPNAHHARFLAVALGFVLLPFASVAAITDADLAKVTQLIQEGKTARAKAEITILLDDNPDDANAPKLRKLLTSLEGSSSSGAAKPPVSGSAATKEATAEWIAKNVNVLQSRKSRTLDGGRDVFFALRGSDVILTWNSWEHTDGPMRKVVEVAFDLSTLNASVGDKDVLLTSTKPNIRARVWCLWYWSGRVNKWFYEHDNVSDNFLRSIPLPHSTLMARRSLSEIECETWKNWNGSPETDTQDSRVTLYLSNGFEDYAPRMRAAFENLIKLSGGGGKEPF